MELILTQTGRRNFTPMARCGRPCESRFRQNFKKAFDWFKSNKSFLESAKGHCIAIAIDPCYISKSGKKSGRRAKCTKGMDYPDSLTGWYLMGVAWIILHTMTSLRLITGNDNTKISELC